MDAKKIEWIVSPEQQPTIESALIPALRFVPPWLQSLTVRYDPSEENLAAIHVQPEYRHANLRIGNAWFSEIEEERAVALLHEVLHCHIEALAVVYDGLMQATTEEGPLKTWAAEAWRRAEEAVVCDLSRVLRGGGDESA